MCPLSIVIPRQSPFGVVGGYIVLCLQIEACLVHYDTVPLPWSGLQTLAQSEKRGTSWSSTVKKKRFYFFLRTVIMTALMFDVSTTMTRRSSWVISGSLTEDIRRIRIVWVAIPQFSRENMVTTRARGESTVPRYKLKTSSNLGFTGRSIPDKMTLNKTPWNRDEEVEALQHSRPYFSTSKARECQT